MRIAHIILSRGFAGSERATVEMCNAQCAEHEVLLILKRGRHDVRGCSVKLTSERAASDPKVFTKIHMHWTVRGRGLKRNIVESAVRLTHEKYCSATAMLQKTAEVTRDFEVIEA